MPSARPVFVVNSLGRKREPLGPPDPGKPIGLYVCGVTPYDRCHVGHARCYVVFDIVRRTLERFGYRLRHIQNFTDVDDKIIARAREKGESPRALAERCIADYFRRMDELNIRRADEYPRVTTHMADILELIGRLVRNGLAYAAQGSVYYAVRKFPGYGRLSGRTLDDMIAGSRVEPEPGKRDPLDFALWKAAAPEEPEEVIWDSPWGRGRPGWHIECSAMSMKYLGEDFDIHGGGQDLIFPHHENEIAQSCGGTGRGFARIWLHNGFININQRKMSKSLGNFFTLEEVLSRFDPMAVRYFLMSQHYRSPADFSDTELRTAAAGWDRILQALRRVDGESARGGGLGEAFETQRRRHLELFDAALSDDFNTPQALSAVHGWVSMANERVGKAPFTQAEREVFMTVLAEMLGTLGLETRLEEAGPEVRALAGRREAARMAKNWAEADRLRQDIKNLGFIVEDSPQGPQLRKVH